MWLWIGVLLRMSSGKEFKPTPRMWVLLAAVAAVYCSGLVYVWSEGLSFRALYLYGLLQ